jgi:hypothetical protein
MRENPQCFIEGDDVGEVTPLGTAPDPPPPLERSKQAGDLALDKAFTL